MNNMDTNKQKNKQNPLYTYILTYYIDDDRIERGFSSATEAIDEMCELGKGCVRRRLLTTMDK